MLFALLAILIAVGTLAFVAASLSRQQNRIERKLDKLLYSVVTFEEGEEFDPTPPKGENARVTRAEFVRRTPVRKLVRQYSKGEDANNPLQK